MRQFLILSIVGMILCIAIIAYNIGYQNGVIDGSQAHQSLYALLGGAK